MRLLLTSASALHFLIVAPLAFIGCSSPEAPDDDGTPPSVGGAGGSGGGAGANNAGRGGSAGTGSPTGGSAGSAVSSGGSAGSAVSSGGSAGSAVSSGGSAGTGVGGAGATSGGSAGTGTSAGGSAGMGAGAGGSNAGASGSAGMGAGAGGTGAGTGGSGGGSIGDPVEDPSASCTVGALPSMSSLMANDKLPDPFKKLDGTAMTSKNEWLCRREEILKQGYEFIYGEKPRTPASAVSGTVSNTSISVSVKDGGSGMFNASVSLPTTGTKPYPAVITYSGVASTLTTEMKNRGVAVINYDPYSVGSEQTKGTGAFYSVYGMNHEGGLLTAWAWGVSRILDVLEKNPGTIDPTKIAVTGCSRFGKGALIAGAFDHRIALTIPMESGIGGTPALRLIEQLDSYSGSEWPYHAISYEPWFSPSQLGPFTNANSASGDNTNKLPIDTHEIMMLIAPRGLYIVDNPSTNYAGLDRNSAYVTGSIEAKLFEALGVKANFTYQAASGSHCQWRSAYTAPLIANIEKFLLGDASAETGTFATDLGGTKPNPDSYMGFTIPTLSGEL